MFNSYDTKAKACDGWIEVVLDNTALLAIEKLKLLNKEDPDSISDENIDNLKDLTKTIYNIIRIKGCMYPDTPEKPEA